MFNHHVFSNLTLEMVIVVQAGLVCAYEALGREISGDDFILVI